MAGAVNASSYASNGTDYAEMMENLYANESIGAGDVVGVFGGRITKKTEGAASVMVVSSSPGVIGNGGLVNGVAVAFIGQVPAKVERCAKEGQFIVPSGLNDGRGRAVNKTINNLISAIGTAWESGCDSVNVAVGVK